MTGPVAIRTHGRIAVAIVDHPPVNALSHAVRAGLVDAIDRVESRTELDALVIAGKTSTPEFGILPVTEPDLHGPTKNPWDPSRTPGGSSGGAAAVVAAGIVPVAQGGDGGGSIRIPASCCGVFGLKPSRGRTPVGPHDSEIFFGFAIEHVLSRTVRDSAAMLDWTGYPEDDAPYAPAPKTPYEIDVLHERQWREAADGIVKGARNEKALIAIG